MKTKSLSFVFNRVKEITLPGTVLLVSLFLTGQFLYPKFYQTFTFHQELKQNESQVLKLEKKAAFLKGQKNENILALYEKINQVFPSEKDVAGLLVSLEGLKNESGLKVQNLDLSAGLLATEGAKSKVSEKEFGFRLNLLGSYENFINFLKKLEKTAPLTSVEKTQVRFNLGKEDIAVNLTFKAHYSPPKNEKSLPIEQPLPELSSSLKNVSEKLLEFEIFTYTPFLPDEEIGKENPFSF